MEYTDKKVIGDAGEYYFAYWITKIFRWPCRQLDIDLGIDAQLEILDDKNNTTGDFIAVQVKTIKKSKKSKSVQVTEDNLEYWKSITIPVIVVYVELDTLKIHWMRVNDKKINTLIHRASKNLSRKALLKFQDELTDNSKSQIIKLLYPEEELLNAIELISEMCETSREGIQMISDDGESIKPSCNLDHFESSVSSLDLVFIKYSELKELLKKHTNMDSHLDTCIDDECNYTIALELMNNLMDLVTDFFNMLYEQPEQWEYLEDLFKRGYLHYKLQAMYDKKRYNY